MRGTQKTVKQHSGVAGKASVPQVEDAPVVAKVEEVKEVVNKVEAPEEFVTLTASDPRMKLEASVNGEVWSGHSITIPKAAEGDVRRMLETAGMYVKN